MENTAHLQYIEELGKKLYAKIMEVESITEQDCIDYMKELVINRTYEGYNTEIQTIYGQLAVLLNQEILAAPDEWDRLYNVDFYIKIGENHIGLQIKPINNHLQIPEIHKEYALQAKTHEKFKKQYGGKVFYIYSEKVNNKKVIANIEVVDKIKEEIARLSNINI
ncbi:MAG: MjaI family restriction endonuclease [Bacteroidales bacterium]|nr:MjaI family restriction endonuclease [Bacteroidales bacterium]